MMRQFWGTRFFLERKFFFLPQNIANFSVEKQDEIIKQLEKGIICLGIRQMKEGKRSSSDILEFMSFGLNLLNL